MAHPGRHFFASARGRLLLLNLLVVAVTLMVSGVAVMGFRHASQMQELVQQQTVDDMTGSLNLARHGKRGNGGGAIVAGGGSAGI